MAREYYCSNCSYSNDIQSHVQRHINRKKSCGKNPQLLEREIDIECEHCDNNLSSRRSLKEHIKTCKVLKLDREAQLKQKIKELEKENELLKSNANTIINNGNIINVNIQVNGYNDTDFSKITDKLKSLALGKTLMSIPKMIENTHFNPNIPENQNIYISNQRGKYAMVYNGQDWAIQDQNETINKLIDDHEYALEEWVNEVGDKHPKEMKKFQKYMNVKEKDGAEEAMKEEVRMLLYNKRNVVSK